jgi:5'-nucleotidase
MRAAVITTVIVLLVFVAWANLRRAAPDPAHEVAASATSGEALPDVAAPPADAEAAAPAAEPSYETAAAEAPAVRSHVVAEGETLAAISQRHYGDEAHAEAIYEANRDQIRDPAQLHAGQTLILP